MQQRVKTPSTEQEFEQYYQLRYRILREPWKQAIGSERDHLEQNSIHAIVVGDNGDVIAGGRLHMNDVNEAQIRYMSVEENYRGSGLGRKIIEYLEQKAIEISAKHIVLNARKDTIEFYNKNGYVQIADAETMFGVIEHVKMYKKL